MNDFDYDCYLKKKIARGEKHRVKKKRGCHLPSDNLTESQRRKLNGECKTVNLNEPIKYDEYKELPISLQETYYNHIVLTYGVGCPSIAEMMGVTEAALRLHNKRNGINVLKSKTGRNTHDVESFRAFWQGEDYVKEDDSEPFDGDMAELNNVVSLPTTEEVKASTLKGYDFVFNGVSDWNDILRLIGNMPLSQDGSFAEECKSDNPSKGGAMKRKLYEIAVLRGLSLL